MIKKSAFWFNLWIVLRYELFRDNHSEFRWYSPTWEFIRIRVFGMKPKHWWTLDPVQKKLTPFEKNIIVHVNII
jgi:hypothetical protein